MPTLAQFLFRPIPASITILRGIGRVHGDHFTESRAFSITSGTLSLMREDSTEHGPGGIRDRLGEAVVLHHAFDIELFDGNHPEAVDNTPCGLVNEVMAAVTNALMDAGNHLFGLALAESCLRAAAFPSAACLLLILRFGVFSLSFGKGFFVTTEEARVSNERAVGQGQKGIQASIKTDGFFGGRQEVIVLFNREAGEPFPADPVDAGSA